MVEPGLESELESGFSFLLRLPNMPPNIIVMVIAATRAMLRRIVVLRRPGDGLSVV